MQLKNRHTWMLLLAPPVLLLTPMASASAQSAATSEQVASASPAAVPAEIKFKPQNGKVTIADAKLDLDLGTQYDFYPAAEAKTIVTQVWGNPPENAANVLGLVMPAGASPYSQAWGAVISYDNSGYVSDEDAASTDYDALLNEMQSGEDTINEDRRKMGYPALNLVGWAERPKYSAASHSVVWAQNIRAEGQAENLLNYDVRMLGRYGVVSMNFVSSMSQLPQIKAAALEFTSHAAFADGARYMDFDASTDEVADYGVGGLVAAGLGLGAAKKLGILGAILAFGKKGIVLLFALIGGLWGAVRRFFRKEEEVVWEEEEPSEAPPSA